MIFTYTHSRSGFGSHGRGAEKHRLGNAIWLPPLMPLFPDIPPRFKEKQMLSRKILRTLLMALTKIATNSRGM